MRGHVTAGQIQMIQVAKSKLGLDDETYRELLRERYDVESAKDLSAGDAKHLIEYFKSKGFKPVRKHRRSKVHGSRSGNNIVAIATDAQHDKIDVLRGLIRWRVRDGYFGWISKFFRIDEVKTDAQAVKVIEGLKKMFENQMKADYGDHWHHKAYTDAAINEYIKEHIR